MSDYDENWPAHPYAGYVVNTFDLPKPSGWQCHLFGAGYTGMIWQPTEGNVPNRFHRFMQRLCFGCRWERVK